MLVDDPQGGFRDPRVHYDGGKILFAYRPGGTHHYHLCEINVDGTGFRQLTSGDCDDVDPAYLPDGGIVFASSRCNRFVACNRVPAAIIYRMDADGGNIRCLSANTISEDRPAVLPDGRIVYTRWDYTDRDPEKFRDLWVMNPDGTGQMVLFGGVGRPYPAFFAKCDAAAGPRRGRQDRVRLFAGVRSSRKCRKRDAGRCQSRTGRVVRGQTDQPRGAGFGVEYRLGARTRGISRSLSVVRGLFSRGAGQEPSGSRRHRQDPGVLPGGEDGSRSAGDPAAASRTGASHSCRSAEDHGATGADRRLPWPQHGRGQAGHDQEAAGAGRPAQAGQQTRTARLSRRIHYAAPGPGDRSGRGRRVGFVRSSGAACGLFRRARRKRRGGQADAELHDGHARRDPRMRGLSRTAHGNPR